MKYRLGHIKQYAMWISPIVTSWRTESCDISHETLLFYNSKFFEDQHFFLVLKIFLRLTDISLVFKFF